MFESGLLKKKSIIVTGGGTGLGKSMATRYAELGADLVITSRRQEVINSTAEELREYGGKVLAVSCDVRDPDQVQNMVDQTVNEFGKIDILLNNAAGNFISPTENLSPNGFKTVVDIVLNGTFNCTQAVGKVMRENKGGVILNIVTTYAWTGSGYVVPSACAKAGVLAMTRSLAVEWAKYGIRTVAIAPGPFPTEGAWSRLAPPGLGIKKKMINRVPLKRVGEHIELANLASYLVSDQAGYINGEVVTIDGGEWLQGAGEMNELEKLPKMAWKLLQMTRKKKK
ncbi:MAG: 2,4-dienoyl-CoA reductase [Candidatus Marinimicrobia bacterium]|jgi:NAD(P)-dependent dehydrogenase (short-subunit alcohol dehydrogenase family)|nr:2,4-dienoyl-CoA reductase [Candidatus Neomarinimicrobiota bacterium]MBT3947747.1 2,4-dienoyl-CoA reductase [Candidatus Neomarinimicrobiota bacterium]MBT4065496.1 2,4-dienoyl-CoA reductase [Candidatus Neomarinimicrobiota bacterium]MBT4307820.1 2,4-dienoyl-CoA reductase [Candidatus Neomarinimicrobiota bacterium]MBT4735660.1 2,4-dienoyl-CoA reductase [Candidatus Neomarinimicrobiota bacterium]